MGVGGVYPAAPLAGHEVGQRLGVLLLPGDALYDLADPLMVVQERDDLVVEYAFLVDVVRRHGGVFYAGHVQRLL